MINKITELIVREDNTIYGEYDYISLLQLKLDIINGKIAETLYYRNEHGGIELIDVFGCSTYNGFKVINELLVKIVKAQMNKKIGEITK